MNFSVQKRKKEEKETVPIRLTKKQALYQNTNKSDFYRRLDNLCTKIYEFQDLNTADHPILVKNVPLEPRLISFCTDSGMSGTIFQNDNKLEQNSSQDSTWRARFSDHKQDVSGVQLLDKSPSGQMLI